MNKLFVILVLVSLLTLPCFYERSLLWRVGFSKVSSWHYGNTQTWQKGLGNGDVELYTPPEPVIGIE